MPGPSAENRGLLQEIYLQDLVLSLYRVYAERLQDPEGRRLIEDYLRAETDRRRGLERCLSARHVVAPSVARALFSGAGRLYGRLPSRPATPIMLRSALSATERPPKRP